MALPDPQMDPEALLDPGTQGFPIPPRAAQSHIARGLAQGPVDLPELRFTQTSRGRAQHWPSVSPAKPWGSKRPSQYSTVRMASPSKRQLLDRSPPEPPKVSHGDGDRSATLPNVESRVVVPEASFRHHRFAVVPCVHETANLRDAQLLMTLGLEETPTHHMQEGGRAGGQKQTARRRLGSRAIRCRLIAPLRQSWPVSTILKSARLELCSLS